MTVSGERTVLTQAAVKGSAGEFPRGRQLTRASLGSAASQLPTVAVTKGHKPVASRHVPCLPHAWEVRSPEIRDFWSPFPCLVQLREVTCTLPPVVSSSVFEVSGTASSSLSSLRLGPLLPSSRLCVCLPVSPAAPSDQRCDSTGPAQIIQGSLPAQPLSCLVKVTGRT